MTADILYTKRKLCRIGAPVVLDSLGNDEFSGYASVFDIPDGAGDVVAKGAFSVSLRKRPASKVRMLYQHFSHEPVGVWETIREDAHGLYVKGRLLLDVTKSRDIMTLIREGAVSGLSIGFKTVRATRNPTTKYRVLKEIELWEISIVTFPLQRESQVLAVGLKSDPLANHIREIGQRLVSP